MAEQEQTNEGRVAALMAEAVDMPVWPAKVIAIVAWIMFAILAVAATYADFATPNIFEIEMHGRKGPWLQGKVTYLFSAPALELVLAIAFSYQAKHWKVFERRSEFVQNMRRRAITQNPTMNLKRLYFTVFAGFLAFEALDFAIGIYRCFYVLQRQATCVFGVPCI